MYLFTRCFTFLNFSNQAGEQDIQLTNDKQVVSHYSDPKKAQQGKPVNQGSYHELLELLLP